MPASSWCWSAIQDESVQTFRGSYPEYLMRRAVEGRLKAKEEQLVGRQCRR